MRILITGLPNSGKTTIFNALTGKNIETTQFYSSSGSPIQGIVKVPDQRLDKLSEILKPTKTIFATVEYIDYIGLNLKDSAQKLKVFEFIKDSDAIVQVVRAFENVDIPHPFESIDVIRDINIFEEEILFHDLDLVEKRLERMNEALKKGKKTDEAEKKILLKCKESLEAENPLRNLSFSEEELKNLRHLQFISIKPEIVVLNISEKNLNSDKIKEVQKEVERYYLKKGFPDKVKILSLCGTIEMELARLEPEVKKVFLDDLGIHESAMYKLIKTCYDLLGLISFITVNNNELRAWTIKKGTNALKAAGKVHSDMERGFIKAEVINFETFMLLKSMVKAKEKGLIRLEGKSYEVKDGDIINFRFNV